MRDKRCLLLFCAFLVLMIGAGSFLNDHLDSAGVEITEIRSDWGNVLRDADGLCHGFVEVYNSSDTAVSLNGWHLSDNTLQLDKYTIVNCEIAPHSYQVFWSNSIEDVQNMDIALDGAFLGFSLETDEPIVLTDPDGHVVSKARIPALDKGESYAKEQGDVWGIRAASPGEENPLELLDREKAEAPVFSLPSGFYEGTVQLEIYAQPGTEIYYTIDGSTPDETSMHYEGPLVLTDATSQPNRYSMLQNITTIESLIYSPAHDVPKIHTIRAVAIDEKGHISDPVNGSYFLDYADRYGFQDVYMLSIITDPQNLFSDEMGIYVLGDVFEENKEKINFDKASWIYTARSNYNSSGKAWRRSVSLELFDTDKRQAASQMGALSIHGNFSTAYGQKSFNVYAQNKETVIFPGVFDSSSSSAMLRAGGVQDSLSTKMRDVLNQNLVADRAVTVQDGIPCQVFINGEYWGLYNLQERINEGLITSSFDVNENNLVILKNEIVVAGEPEDLALYTQVLEYAEGNDLSLSEHYQQMCEWIDMQSYIDYMCFQIYIANCDAIYNNVACWRTRNIVDDEYGDGRWRWILYDTDASAGMIPDRTVASVDSFSGGNWGTPPMEDLLFSSLIQNEEFKRQFAESFIEIAQNNFESSHVLKKIEQMEKVYWPASVISHRRFWDEDFPEHYYTANVQLIKDFYSGRYEHIYQHMLTNLGLEEDVE